MLLVLLLLLLRVSGKRTLSKRNAFGFLVTVAMGSMLASVLPSKDVTPVQGGFAFALLDGLQFVVTWTSLCFKWFRKLVNGEPTLLLFRGELLHDGMRKTRVTEAEVRDSGLRSFDEAEAVVLETDASFGVVQRDRCTTGTVASLSDVQRPA